MKLAGELFVCEESYYFNFLLEFDELYAPTTSILMSFYPISWAFLMFYSGYFLKILSFISPANFLMVLNFLVIPWPILLRNGYFGLSFSIMRIYLS